ncbi:MAG: hypothetical protein GKR94_21740 [Gammaproteobacteria bacterium]|nr:hypothetical protein [Gammaproteobacteria bacterium]
MPSRLGLFQERLIGRDSFPQSRAGEFRDMPQSELLQAAHNTRLVARRIQAEYRYGIAHGQSLRDVLAVFDTGWFSCDHGWRDIFRGLARHGPQHDALRKAALTTYLRYLNSRYEFLMRLAQR